MSDQNSFIEQLKLFATESGRKIKVKKDPYPTTSSDQEEEYRITVVIPEIDDGDLFFIAYSDLKSGSLYSVYSGVFSAGSEPCQSKLSVVKKDWLDRLSFRSGYKSIKTGSIPFDKKTKITSNNPQMVHRLFSGLDSQNAAMSALDLSDGFTISINELVTEQMESFKGFSQLSLYAYKDWILDGSTIEKMFIAVRNLKERWR